MFLAMLFIYCSQSILIQRKNTSTLSPMTIVNFVNYVATVLTLKNTLNLLLAVHLVDGSDGRGWHILLSTVQL